MRSISVSTWAISASAAGVSVVLASSALTTTAPGTATNAAPNIKSATKALIQRDRDIEALRGPQGERFQRLLELQSAAINRYIGAQTGPIRSKGQSAIGENCSVQSTRRSRFHKITSMAWKWLCLHCRDLRRLAQDNGVAHQCIVFVRRRRGKMRREGPVADAAMFARSRHLQQDH